MYYRDQWRSVKETVIKRDNNINKTKIFTGYKWRPSGIKPYNVNWPLSVIALVVCNSHSICDRNAVEASFTPEIKEEQKVLRQFFEHL